MELRVQIELGHDDGTTLARVGRVETILPARYTGDGWAASLALMELCRAALPRIAADAQRGLEEKLTDLESSFRTRMNEEEASS